MAIPRVDCVVDAHNAIGEAAIWSVPEQVLYWVDIPVGELHRYDPATGARRTHHFDSPLGCFALVEGGGVVLALASGFHRSAMANSVASDTELEQQLGQIVPQQQAQRFNDGTVDAQGRFLAGTMALGGIRPEPSGEGVLYRLSADGAVETLLSGFSVINGMTFSPDGRTFYVSDSHAAIRTIWAFDHDVGSGNISNRRVFFDTHSVVGRPDGAAMDTDGCYWMAGVGGWQLLRITPDGQVDQEIRMPVEKPTRVAFGGPDLRTLYVTSIADGLNAAQLADQPQAGGVFALQVPGVQGCALPMMPGLT